MRFIGAAQFDDYQIVPNPGTRKGDLVVAMFFDPPNGVPAGWTLISSVARNVDSSPWYYHVAEDDEPNVWNFGTNGSADTAGIVVCYRDVAVVLDAVQAVGNGSANPATHTLVEQENGIRNRLVLYAAAGRWYGVGSSLGPPFVSFESGISLRIEWKSPPPGATNTRNILALADELVPSGDIPERQVVMGTARNDIENPSFGSGVARLGAAVPAEKPWLRQRQRDDAIRVRAFGRNTPSSEQRGVRVSSRNRYQ